MDFNYTAMRASVFVSNADVSNWTREHWDAFYPEIASYEQWILYDQLAYCKCGKCGHYFAIELN